MSNPLRVRIFQKIIGSGICLYVDVNERACFDCGNFSHQKSGFLYHLPQLLIVGVLEIQIGFVIYARTLAAS